MVARINKRRTVMKKLVNTAFKYMILGLALGLFYREYTKFVGFSGATNLSLLHTHTLVLGMFFFLVAALFEGQIKISKHKSFKKFYITYNLGLLLSIVMMSVRGLLDIHVTTLSKGLDAAVSGMAGIGHIILTFGLFYFFKALRDQSKA